MDPKGHLPSDSTQTTQPGQDYLYENQFGDMGGRTAAAQTRGQNNDHEGFYVDNIIIGAAERGEMVTGAGQHELHGFGSRVAHPAAQLDPTVAVPTQVLNGPYQLEVRRGAEYGLTDNGSANATGTGKNAKRQSSVWTRTSG